jgi:hypothetical protein
MNPARFRRHAFGWRSQPAIRRVKQAVSEIKMVARGDPVRAADGAVTLLERLSPALEHVDSWAGGRLLQDPRSRHAARPPTRTGYSGPLLAAGRRLEATRVATYPGTTTRVRSRAVRSSQPVSLTANVSVKPIPTVPGSRRVIGERKVMPGAKGW